MTGTEIRAMRHAMGFKQQQFAELLGVSVQTVYRWEQRRDDTPPIEPMQRSLLEACRRVANKKDGAAIARALGAEPLRGLYTMLGMALECSLNP